VSAQDLSRDKDAIDDLMLGIADMAVPATYFSEVLPKGDHNAP
jgi:hypothetical protein